MTDLDHEAARIAAGLTKGARLTLIHMIEGAHWWTIANQAALRTTYGRSRQFRHTFQPLMAEGLVARQCGLCWPDGTLPFPTFHTTPLGLRVRDILSQDKSNG